MKRVAVGMIFLLTGCTPLVIERRAAKLATEVRAIHSDLSTLSATFTPEQSAKYAQAKAAQDDATFQAFYASLNEQQQAQMKKLLDRVHQVGQERQVLSQAVQQDLAMRCWAHRHVPDIAMVPPIGGI